ncbi:Hypothetical predicted protein [Olea europaea subsp. europaea]|uniref:Uncharacterized protein n=1 Tax=Olea europaea subsp. europaea TaxID=158383 RepID=A0A8S0TNX0_OLEEU|nr:Hypothetical predicted protein [Olea europaea subsp. europaea]
MGKASRRFRRLMRFKKSDSNPDRTQKPLKKKWSFVKSHKEKSSDEAVLINENDIEVGKHMIMAADAIVKLTNNGRNTEAAGRGDASYGNREERAAIKIQSHFCALCIALFIVMNIWITYNTEQLQIERVRRVLSQRRRVRRRKLVIFFFLLQKFSELWNFSPCLFSTVVGA